MCSLVYCHAFLLSTSGVEYFQPIQTITLWMFRNKIRFYGKEILAPRPKSKLEDHPLSDVRDCLFNIFAATLHNGGRSTVRNLRTFHAVVTRTHLSWNYEPTPRSLPEEPSPVRKPAYQETCNSNPHCAGSCKYFRIVCVAPTAQLGS